MKSIPVPALAFILALFITPSEYTYGHHINKNAPPGKKHIAKKKKTTKVKINKTIEEKVDSNKKVLTKKQTDAVKKVTNNIKKETKIPKKTVADSKESIATKSASEPNINIVKPITATPALVKAEVTEPTDGNTKVTKPVVTSPAIAIQKQKSKTPLTSTSSKTNENTFIKDKKTQGALIGSVVLGAATANPVGLVLGGVGGYMVGKGEQTKIEQKERDAKKQKAVKPAPLQANYQACKKMARSKTRTRLPFCFYSME